MCVRFCVDILGECCVCPNVFVGAIVCSGEPVCIARVSPSKDVILCCHRLLFEGDYHRKHVGVDHITHA